MDFGTIMCWADNNVGQQKEPCVFHLIAAGKPEAPTNCTVVNQTSDSLEVYCLEGEYQMPQKLLKLPANLPAFIIADEPINGQKGKSIHICIYSIR